MCAFNLTCSCIYFQLLDYHTSAILAATLDTASLPYRTVNPIHLCDITNNFQTLGKKVSFMYLCTRHVMQIVLFVSNLLCC